MKKQERAEKQAIFLWGRKREREGGRQYTKKQGRKLEMFSVTEEFLVHSWEPSSVQLLSHVWLFATPWIATCQASLSITNSQSLLKFMSTESGMPSNHLFLCRPLLLPSSIFPASGSFQMSLFFTSGGQSIGV